ncbi:TetR/AcrR family transcriptional regulator [Crossiella sp. CA-258035]|uniref:TetR/AcrR family transcriptional regulator n=1 Tax=Crossiella sp. CA-258035 TaxID=2981138 RepID=UPI0024BD0A48|nr:TetR/AcrR family transcriptional regulator [Crossiella sp. CA-258035]WHT21367.1 TetR/AcrR family transcriptional regulator [Crossiella sp. CA-258035]
MPAKIRKTRADWTTAALAALAEGGLAAVAIEPLAVRVGATKGSAYWHFANREALLVATLERWELEHTEAVIALAEQETDPAHRLRLLFASVLDRPEGNAVELALLAAGDDPVIRPVLDRVTDRRIAYLSTLFAQCGFGKADARRRAVLAYSAYLGHAHLFRMAPAAMPRSRAQRRAHLDASMAALLSKENGSG